MGHRYLFALLLCITMPHFLVAHSHSSRPLRASIPRAGTIIVNTYYVTDSSGALVPKSIVDPEMVDDTLRVIRSDFRIFGRPHCIEIAPVTHNDTTLISYANNGDLYMRILGRDTAWAHLPFGTAPGTVIRKKVANDSGTMFHKDFDMPHTQTFEVLGNDTASTGGIVYHCIKLQIVDIRNYQGTDWLQGTLYWYAPELGYFVRMNFGWDGPYFLNQQLKEYRVPSTE
ncbi:MAG TPA: hypothetical protein VFD13_08855 [Candidatus Kapabacteria bacterium]|nr:hypothetical protein [Candidatus Kapabacteria bacterium]